MRPTTLSEAIERIESGTPSAIAVGEFLDHFYTTPGPLRAATLVTEPPLLDDPHVNALAAAIAEHLTKAYSSERPPAWVENPARFLRWPWFTARSPDPALCDYLTCYSPAAFKRRNIMTDAAPLRRARAPFSESQASSP